MKRELFQNITAIPYTSGDAIDRRGFLSAVIGTNIASGATLTIKAEHSDDGETFVAVTDKLVFPEMPTEGGEYTFVNTPIEAEVVEGAESPVETGGLVNVDVDLVGLKPYVKFTVTGATGSPVVVLGDSMAQPV